MKRAEETNNDVIFVTDDVKEDWFTKVKGQNRGGHYKLLNEFFKKTGKLMLIYSTDRFAEAYKKNNPGRTVVDQSFINELKFIRNSAIHTRGFKSLKDSDRIENLISMIKNEKFLEGLRHLTRNKHSEKYDKYTIGQITKYLEYLYEEITSNSSIYKFDTKKLLICINRMRTNLMFGPYNEADIRDGIQYICDTFLFGV